MRVDVFEERGLEPETPQAREVPEREVVQVVDGIRAQVELFQVGQMTKCVRVHVAKIVGREYERFEVSVLIERVGLYLTQAETLFDHNLVKGLRLDERRKRVRA